MSSRKDDGSVSGFSSSSLLLVHVHPLRRRWYRAPGPRARPDPSNRHPASRAGGRAAAAPAPLPVTRRDLHGSALQGTPRRRTGSRAAVGRVLVHARARTCCRRTDDGADVVFNSSYMATKKARLLVTRAADGFETSVARRRPGSARVTRGAWGWDTSPERSLRGYKRVASVPRLLRRRRRVALGGSARARPPARRLLPLPHERGRRSPTSSQRGESRDTRSLLIFHRNDDVTEMHKFFWREVGKADQLSNDVDTELA